MNRWGALVRPVARGGLLSAVGVAGVIGVGARPAAAVVADAPRVVVAVLDSGTNPYHASFQRGAASAVTPSVLAELGIGPSQVIELTRTGNFAADYAADAAKWASIQRNKPYWFKGTNIIGYSSTTAASDGSATTRPILPDDADDTHGVSTSAAVAKANPDAIILFVEGTGTEAEEYAFGNPAVDIVSTSYGIPGSVPGLPELAGSYDGVLLGGKLHFGAADNSPAAAQGDGTAGPFWSIGIAGFHEDTSNGREVSSGNFPDFLGDFAQQLASCFNCESETLATQYGTSFSTPRAAGTASLILLKARQAAGYLGPTTPAPQLPTSAATDEQPVVVSGGGKKVTTWQFRRALEEGGYQPTAADTTPAGLLDDVLDFNTPAPYNPAAPFTTTGWGFVSPADKFQVVAATLGNIGYGPTVARAQTVPSCTFNDGNHDARFSYWTGLATSDAFLTDVDPYLKCGAPMFTTSAVPNPVVPEVPWPALGAATAALVGCLALRRRSTRTA